MKTVQVRFLSEIETATGKVHNGWSGGVRHDMSRVATRKVEPVLVTGVPLALSVGWGDRDDAPPVWGDIGTLHVECSSLGVVRGSREGYDAAISDEMRAAVLGTWTMVRDAVRAAALARPDVAAVRASYDAIVKSIEDEYAAHDAQWVLDSVAIARAFRRATVQIGEQTVPGKCCVRSTRGRMLGYANVWDGRWLGTVERAR